MITLDLNAGAAKLYTAPVIQGGNSDLQRIDSMRVQYGRTYKVQIREVAEDTRYKGGSIYTLRGTIQQDDAPTTPSSTDIKYTPASKLYSITTKSVSLATIGVIPIDGWRSALRDKTAFKVTSPEASRELVLPTLLLGDTVEQLIASRDQLEWLLYSETRNQLTTPYGAFACTFVRSRVRGYWLGINPHIFYDLTITLV